MANSPDSHCCSRTRYVPYPQCYDGTLWGKRQGAKPGDMDVLFRKRGPLADEPQSKQQRPRREETSAFPCGEPGQGLSSEKRSTHETLLISGLTFVSFLSPLHGERGSSMLTAARVLKRTRWWCPCTDYIQTPTQASPRVSHGSRGLFVSEAPARDNILPPCSSQKNACCQLGLELPESSPSPDPGSRTRPTAHPHKTKFSLHRFVRSAPCLIPPSGMWGSQSARFTFIAEPATTRVNSRRRNRTQFASPSPASGVGDGGDDRSGTDAALAAAFSP